MIHDMTKESVKYSKIPESWFNYIIEPRSIVTVKFPVEMADGVFRTITGTKIIHSNHHLPSKGGLRISSDTNIDDLEGLACLKTIKASLHDIPFGGSASCIYINPEKLNFEEKVRIVRRFIVEMWKRSMISASTDVMGPDRGTDQILMNVIKETLKNIVNVRSVDVDASVTGKTLALGGIGCSGLASAYGVARAFSFVEENINNPILAESGLGSGRSKKSVIIDGFSQKSFDIAKYLTKIDFKIIGITDREHGCFNAAGFDPVEIWEYRKLKDGLQGISKTMNVPEEILTQRCDILLATKELGIRKTIAEKLRCKMVIEGNNVPLSYDASLILRRRNIPVIPDLISYSGSFIVAYLEWLKNLEHKNLTLLFKRFESNSRKTMIDILATSEYGSVKDDYEGPTEDKLVLSTLEEIMDGSFHTSLALAQELGTDLRTAAYKIAMDKIYDKYRHIGGINF